MIGPMVWYVWYGNVVNKFLFTICFYYIHKKKQDNINFFHQIIFIVYGGQDRSYVFVMCV